MTKSQIGIIGVGAFILILLGVAFVFGRKQTAPPPAPPSTVIDFWGFEDDRSAWVNAMIAFQSARPGVVVNYKTVNSETYETELIDNLAGGTGPDIFLLHYDWLSRHRNKIAPAPNQLINSGVLPNFFPKTVSDDFVRDGQVYALPMSINTMALAYNRDYFDAKAVPLPPQNWTEIKNLIPKLREVQGGKVTKPAIGLGSSERNVKNAADILTLMMLQNGVEVAGNLNETAVQTVNEYLDFSDPRSRNYAFDAGGAANSLNLFAAGKAGMAFIYPHDIKTIRDQNQTLNMRILPMPQLNPNNPVNLTDYWGLTVSKTSSKQYLAWDFIVFATTNTEVARNYAIASGNQPALRSAVEFFTNDPVLGVFAPQVLNAVSTPKEKRDVFRSIINNMIESSLNDRANIEAHVSAANSAIVEQILR